MEGVLGSRRGGVVVTYLRRLEDELGRVGIRGRTRARILAEAADHLAEGREERFGEPAELARLFADDLATSRSRRAAYAAFGALAAAGAGFAAAWVSFAQGGWPDIASAGALGIVAAVGMVVFPQFALAAGLLALLGAVRARGAAAELELLRRRTRYALVFGALSLGAIALYAAAFDVHTGWVVAGATLLAVPLAVSALLVHGAAALTSSVPGDAD